MACTRQKGFSTHGFFSRGLHLIQDEKSIRGTNRGLILTNNPLSYCGLPRLHMPAMDFEQCSIESHEGAGPWVEGADATLQFVSWMCEIQLACLFFQHGRVGHTFFGLRQRLDFPG